jgi:site-specific recombinase XerD
MKNQTQIVKAFLEGQIQKGNAEATAKRQVNSIKNYNEWCKSEEIKPSKSSYQNMMDYIEYLQSTGNKTRTIRQKLTALGHYFEFLNVPNPALLIKLKGSEKTVPNRLLTGQELIEIYQLYPTHGITRKRNKVLLSLLVFQGVCPSELPNIELKDVDLNNGTIYIPSIRTTNARTLELKAHQLLLFQDYLLKVRPLILQQANKQSDRLLITTGQSNKLRNIIAPILKQIRCEYPRLRTFQQVRQSVVQHWIKEHGLRKAQYMAGHRFASSTDRYSENEMEGLKRAIKSNHPLR